MQNENRTIILIGIFIALFFMIFIACDDEYDSYRYRDSDEVGWIGVRVTRLTWDLRQELDAKSRRGVVITDVIEDSPADEAGLKQDDIIVRFDRKRIRSEDDLIKKVRNCEPGKKVKLEIERLGKNQTLALRVGEMPRRYARRHRDSDWRIDLDFPSREEFSVRLVKPDEFQGAKLQELNADLAEYFKVDKNDGLLILEVEADSPADEAKLKAGDILTGIDKYSVSSIDELHDALDSFDEGDSIEIKYIRNGEKATTELEVEKKRRKIKSRRYFRFHPPVYRFELDEDELEEEIAIFQEELGETIRDEVLRNLHDNLEELDDFDFDFDDFKRDMKRLKEDLKQLEVEIKGDWL